MHLLDRYDKLVSDFPNAGQNHISALVYYADGQPTTQVTNLVVPNRWDGGKDEDPRIAALLSAKRDLSPSRIDSFFEGGANGAERRA